MLTPEILHERALQYARQDEKIKLQGELKQYLGFRLGQEYFLIEMVWVHEVVPMSRITRLPLNKDLIRGVMNIRGEVMMILSLEEVLGLNPIKVDQGTARIVVLNIGQERVGLLVDEVKRNFEWDSGLAQTQIPNLKMCRDHWISGLFQQEGHLWGWLDIEKIYLEIKQQLSHVM